MACFHPLDARRSPAGTIAFKAMTPFDQLIKLPCGKCSGCRLERSRQTAIRLMHEAQLHERTCFITPTYNDDYLPTRQRLASSEDLTARRPPRGLTSGTSKAHARENRAHEDEQASLWPRDLTLFTKRLNYSVTERFGKGVRYYAVGEYGGLTNRPHYHIAVFGEDFADDRQFWKWSKSGHALWRSSRLQDLWGMGDVDIGELTFESAAYIARYMMKKVLGTSEKAEKMRDERYRRTDASGQDYWLEPEFNRMSRNPGLGSRWFEAFKNSVYPHDRVVVRGHPCKPPRYYDELLKRVSADEYALIKHSRELVIAAKNPGDFTPERLRAGEAILQASLTTLKRPLEK